jgi:hypothetical protein
MHTAVLTTLLHVSSTDEDPRHQLCPEGENSWCFFQRAISKNEEPRRHTVASVSQSHDVVQEMRPVYARLSEHGLMERCRRGKTQNPNEGLTSLIWRRCPKTVFVGRKRVEETTASGMGYFIDGESFSPVSPGAARGPSQSSWGQDL